MAKNTIFLSIRMFIVLCISLYTTRIVLENLGISDYGIYNVVCGFVSLFMFINTSLSNGIQRFYNFELGKNGEQALSKVYSTSLLIQFIVIIVVLILTESIGLWYLNNKMVIPADRLLTAKYIYQLSILSFIVVILQSPFSAAVLAFERMDYYAVVSIIATLLKLLVAISLQYCARDRLLYYGIFLFAVSIIEFILYYAYVRIKFKSIKRTRLEDYSLLKSMWIFSGWNIFGTFSSIVKEQGVNLILNFFCGPVVNAARGIAVQVNGGLQSFVNNFTIPVRPQVIKSYASGDVDRTMALTFTISKISCYFLYMLALPIIAEINFILHIWLGKDVPEYTSSFVIIIIITSFMNNLNAAVSGVVHASGKMKLYQLSTSFAGLLSLPLAYLALKFFDDPNLALLMIFITMILVQVISLFVLKGIVTFSIRSYVKEVISPLAMVIISTFFIPLLSRAILEPGWLRLGMTLVSSLIAVSLSIYFIGTNQSEKIILRTLIDKLLKR